MIVMQERCDKEEHSIALFRVWLVPLYEDYVGQRKKITR